MPLEIPDVTFSLELIPEHYRTCEICGVERYASRPPWWLIRWNDGPPLTPDRFDHQAFLCSWSCVAEYARQHV